MKLKDNSTQEIDTALYQLEQKLKSNIRLTDVENSNASTAKINAVDKKLTEEVKDRQSADEKLQDNINKEIADRQEADAAIENAKQDKLIAGNNIQIDGNVISATSTEYTAEAPVKVTDGIISLDTVPVANGGTGVTTQADINKAFIGNLNVGNDNVTDGTEFVSSWASDKGFADPSGLNKPYKRQFIKVWNYIKGKISSVLGLTKDNYGGKAAKSSFLDEYPGAGGTRLTSGNIVPKDASEYGGIRKDIVSDSMTDSGRPGQDGHLLTMFWDNAGRYDSQFFVSNNNPLTVKARVKANGTDYGPWVDIITSNNIGSQTVASAASADRTIGIDYTGESDGCISAEQTPESYNNSDANWASYIICNHGNGTTYYHQMLRLSFFSDSIQFQRRVGGELQGWRNVAIMENENTWSGRQNFTTAKASSKMIIPIGEPSSLEDGCLWIER